MKSLKELWRRHGPRAGSSSSGGVKPRAARSADPIVVDDRERPSGLAGSIERITGRKVEIERLEVGDVLIGGQVLLERKTAADFAASLADGRLFAQVSALRAETSLPLLVLEGEISGEAIGKLSVAALRGAILSVSLDWKVPILRSRSVDDTARWIGAIAARYAASGPTPQWGQILPDGSRRSTQALPWRPRRPRRSPEASRRRQAIEMLSAIEGVGPVRAEQLLGHFKTLSAVFTASPREVEAVSGVGPRLAAAIHSVLHDAPCGPEGRQP